MTLGVNLEIGPTRVMTFLALGVDLEGEKVKMTN